MSAKCATTLQTNPLKTEKYIVDQTQLRSVQSQKLTTGIIKILQVAKIHSALITFQKVAQINILKTARKNAEIEK